MSARAITGRRPTTTLPRQVDPAVTKVVVDSYYPKLVDLAGAARTRAQNGFTVASGLATALLAVFFFADLPDYHGVVQGLTVAALIAWVVSAACNVWAVSAPVRAIKKVVNVRTGMIAHRVIGAALRERSEIDRRQGLGFLAAALAALFMILALIGALALGKESSEISAQVFLSDTGTSATARMCGGEGLAEVSGDLDPAAVNSNVVPVRAAAGVCGADATTILIPRDQISGIVKVDSNDED